jgi:hypothetical protein
VQRKDAKQCPTLIVGGGGGNHDGKAILLSWECKHECRDDKEQCGEKFNSKSTLYRHQADPAAHPLCKDYPMCPGSKCLEKVSV